MHLYKRPAPLQKYISQLRTRQFTIGFVPTMGALHEGHLSLIKQSKRECDVTVCSIFVNPRQFNNPADLEKYPRTEDKDIMLLTEAGCDVLYMPDNDTVYAGQQVPDFKLGEFTGWYEGASRPGHFAGVVAVVKIFLETVMPDKAFFGQKDFQQTRVVKWLVKEFRLPVEIVVSPTIREPDGLAMSSRNVRLTAENRAKAPVIYRALQHIQQHAGQKEFNSVIQEAIDMIDATGLKTDYLVLADSETLEQVHDWNDAKGLVALVAVQAGDIRLIDNEIVR